jgi:hypothetical protein
MTAHVIKRAAPSQTYAHGPAMPATSCQKPVLAAVRVQGPGKVVAGVRVEVIGVDAPSLEVAGRA